MMSNYFPVSRDVIINACLNPGTNLATVKCPGALLLPWFNFNPSMDIFEVKLIFEILTVRRQQH